MQSLGLAAHISDLIVPTCHDHNRHGQLTGYLPIAKVGLRQMPPMRAKSFYQVCRFAGLGNLVLVGYIGMTVVESYSQ